MSYYQCYLQPSLPAGGKPKDNVSKEKSKPRDLLWIFMDRVFQSLWGRKSFLRGGNPALRQPPFTSTMESLGLFSSIHDSSDVIDKLSVKICHIQTQAIYSG